MIPIRIKKRAGALVAESEGKTIITFHYSKDQGAWVFVVNENMPPIKKEGRGFPWLYFLELCRFCAFFFHDAPMWNCNGAKVISGKSYIR